MVKLPLTLFPAWVIATLYEFPTKTIVQNPAKGAGAGVVGVKVCVEVPVAVMVVVGVAVAVGVGGMGAIGN
jgi:hypothetical protein